MNDDLQDNWVSANEAAVHFHISERHLRRLVSDGVLRRDKKGRLSCEELWLYTQGKATRGGRYGVEHPSKVTKARALALRLLAQITHRISKRHDPELLAQYYKKNRAASDIAPRPVLEADLGRRTDFLSLQELAVFTAQRVLQYIRETPPSPNRVISPTKKQRDAAAKRLETLLSVKEATQLLVTELNELRRQEKDFNDLPELKRASGREPVRSKRRGHTLSSLLGIHRRMACYYSQQLKRKLAGHVASERRHRRYSISEDNQTADPWDASYVFDNENWRQAETRNQDQEQVPVWRNSRRAK